jgi:hypothetical protein
VSDGITVDTHEIDELAALFLEEAATLDVRVTPIVEANARRVRDDARQNASGHPSLPHYPASITYDMVVTGQGVAADIGPDKDLPQGPLGNIIEYGTANNAPMGNLAKASAQNEARFEAELAAVPLIV